MDQNNKTAADRIRLMEVCGTHTSQIARLGIRTLLPPHIQLLSGPGCPVCVTPAGFIDASIALVKNHSVILVTFGDLLRVSGADGTLEMQRAEGRAVEVVYSPEEVIALSRKNRQKSIVFAAVGFETTAPLFAALIKMAEQEQITNLYFLTSLKRMDPAIAYILKKPGIHIDGMLCPGHVAAVTGIGPFLPITERYGVPAVICGFEGEEILAGIETLYGQITGKMPVKFLNLYSRCVQAQGNMVARNLMDEVFVSASGLWRGIGEIKNSALVLNQRYEAFDAAKRFDLSGFMEQRHPDDGSCECGKILTGEKTPDQCAHFGRSCTREHPKGPCMISSEGACSVFYRYKVRGISNGGISANEF